MTDRVCIDVGGTRVCGHGNQDRVRKLFEDAVNELMIPVRFPDTNFRIGDVYIGRVEIDVRTPKIPIKIPIEVMIDCGTSSMFYGANILLPNNHPLRPLIVKALREFYSKYVEKIDVHFWDYLIIDNQVYREGVEEEKVICKYNGYWRGDAPDSIDAYLPLKPLKHILEKHLANADKIMKVLEKAKEIVDRVEKEMSEDAEFEFDNKVVEWVKKRLRRSYLGVFYGL